MDYTHGRYDFNTGKQRAVGQPNTYYDGYRDAMREHDEEQARDRGMIGMCEGCRLIPSIEHVGDECGDDWLAHNLGSY